MRKLLAALLLIPGLAFAQNIPQPLEVSQSGSWTNACTQSGSWTVTANAGTNLSTAALALESGGNLAAIASKDFATQTTLSALNAKVTACNTGAVVVSSSALPTGACTAANQSTIIGHVDGLESAFTTLNAKDFATETTLAAINAKVAICDTDAVTISALPNEGQQTMANSVSVALASNQSALPVTDNSGSLTVDNAGTFPVQAAQSGTWTVQPGNTANTTAWLVTGTGGTFPVTDSGGSLTVDNSGTFATQAAQSGTWNITNVSGTVSLPTGAATSANQSTEITSLQLLDDTVATAGSAALTKLYQVGGTDGTNARTLSTNTSGHLNIADGGNSITVDNGGTFATQATQSGTWNINNVSGTISLPTGAATESTLSTLNGKVTACNTGAVTVSAALPAGTNAIGKVDHSTTGIATGRKTITTAGTREALASSTSAKWVCITAETDNTGIVVVGGTSVVATLASRQGTPLDAGDDVCLPVDNLADINLDVTVNGEGVTYTYGT